MKEININIEGYNVNGICVGCLHYKRKMFYHEYIKECFKTIGNIDVPDGLEIQLCWECMASVRRIKKFQEQILESYEFLINYSTRFPFLNSSSDFTKHARTTLRVCSLDNVSYPDEDTGLKAGREIEIDVKNELKFEEAAFLDNEILPVKDEEEDSNILQNDDFHYSYDNILYENEEMSSEDDVKLSKLKKKKHKKEKRSKKRDRRKKEEDGEKVVNKEQEKISRKLKNLPTDVVALYTMTEEEMWVVRSQDVVAKEFSKLKYRCDQCIIGFNTSKLRDEHFNGKHRKKGEDTQCDVCKAYFLVKDNILAHRSLHLTAYHCIRCDMKTTLKRVMMKHPCVQDSYSEEFKCVTCGNLFSTKSKLAYHRIVCDQERPQCDCCGKVFANKMTLKYHLKILPQNKEDKAKEKLYIPCKGCDKIFHSKKSYRAHVVIHNGLTYPCQVCGKLFQWKRNLARHMRNHRERDIGATHECRECGKTFSSRDCYNNHMKLSKKHATESTYAHECNFCGKKFPTKWCMVDHIDWDHIKRIKYRCGVCFKAFKTAKIMVAHINNLHKDKKIELDGEHLCEICGKSYKTVKRLKSHVWSMHTNRSVGKNSYSCKLCPATFTWQTSIYKHMKMMHGQKRNKVLRPNNVYKKQEPYTDVKVATPMDYIFPQNTTNSLMQNML